VCIGILAPTLIGWTGRIDDDGAAERVLWETAPE